jgi:DNA-binding GntR family transcriptional regulator
MRPQTVREQVTRALREELIAGQFEDGQVLREVELADRLGVSRGPVRDAFLQLTHEGFLAYTANRGVVVRPPPVQRNRDFIILLRIQIEVFAVKSGLADMTDEGFQKIESALSDLKTACLGNNAAAVAHCDMAFHEAILIACGGEDFLEVWRQLCAKMLMKYSRLDHYREVYEEHLHILVPLKSRSKQAVIEALKENIR